ncbi:MAG: carbamoyltransferase C-terminal domain-containing protein [Bacteriovoracaceae bacterium]|jgi:carbamoyltransferase|nr:carbamoyltransferase C-terminal domain-containing protein [Bacteriovoracaceae bacterium]
MQHTTNKHLGLGKTLFNSSVAIVNSDYIDNHQVILSERITRKKASGAWPENIFNHLGITNDDSFLSISENRDVISPKTFEQNINSKLPFFDYLKRKKLDHFSSHFNSNIIYVGHHLAHAYAALAFSPFERSIIIVIDGAGSHVNDLNSEFSDSIKEYHLKGNEHEECSIYLQDGAKLSCLKKHFQTFIQSQNHPQHDFTEGVGLLYEKAAEYIFNNKRAAGKVMGLASFGTAFDIAEPRKYLELLDWSLAYKGATKAEWEESSQMKVYQNIAASVQKKYELHMFHLISDLKKAYPDIDNLIITGGTALNCTNNFKLVQKGLFSNIYIPPFPSDESIGFGCAYSQFITHNPQSWKPKPIHTQHGFLGHSSSIPTDNLVLETFKDYPIEKLSNPSYFAAKLLSENKIIAWFQGRSEIGPRALGNRSILANIKFPDLKNHLNSQVKFRENFRPYGCSVLWEKASEYFQVSNNFHNPYMSFATPIKSKYKNIFSQVIHVDATSRMQTVTPEFNSLYYELIKHVGDLTGIYAVLNTSLNIMGEPIVESTYDAKKLLETTNIDGIVIGNFYIKSLKS